MTNQPGRVPRLFTFVLATLALSPLPSRAQSSRDSAGVLIVENARPAWSERERLSLDATPRLAIGNDRDSSYRFGQVRGVALLSDGRIAVADGASLQLRLFSPDGRFLSVNAGPAQIRNARWIRQLPGDTIAVGAGMATVALYTGTGHPVRTAELPPRPTASAPRRFVLFTLLNARLGVAGPIPDPRPRASGTRWADSIPLALVTDSTAGARELGTFPYIELEQVDATPTPVWLGPGGVYAASDDRFYMGFGDRYAIRVYSADGTLRSIIRRAWTPEPVTADDWEQWVVEWSKRWVKSTGAERERDVQKVRESPWAESLPAFTEMIVARDGRLWVRGAHWQDAIGAGSLADTPAVPSTWSVFDPRGRWLGDVTMPAGFHAFEIGADYVAGVRQSDGLTQVVVHGLGVRKP